MFKYVMMFVVVAAMATTSMTAITAANGTSAAKENLRQSAGDDAPGQNLDNAGARKRGGLASACYYMHLRALALFKRRARESEICTKAIHENGHSFSAKTGASFVGVSAPH